MAGGGGGIQPLGQPGIGQQPALGAPNFFTGGTPLLGQGGNGWNPVPSGQPEISNDPIGGGRGWRPQPGPQISNDPSGIPLWQSRQMDRNSPFYNPNASIGNPVLGKIQQPWQTRQNDPNSPFYRPSLGGLQT